MANKRAMRLLIDDDVIDEFRIAREKERHDRGEVILQLIDAGHVAVVINNNADKITLVIEGESFSCPRAVYPTTELVARIQLARQAGRSEKNVVKPPMSEEVATEALNAKYWVRMCSWLGNTAFKRNYGWLV
jgi:hypothetical protein